MRHLILQDPFLEPGGRRYCHGPSVHPDDERRSRCLACSPLHRSRVACGIVQGAARSQRHCGQRRRRLHAGIQSPSSCLDKRLVCNGAPLGTFGLPSPLGGSRSIRPKNEDLDAYTAAPAFRTYSVSVEKEAARNLVGSGASHVNISRCKPLTSLKHLSPCTQTCERCRSRVQCRFETNSGRELRQKQAWVRMETHRWKPGGSGPWMNAEQSFYGVLNPGIHIFGSALD
jgi:hypothetical protein